MFFWTVRLQIYVLFGQESTPSVSLPSIVSHHFFLYSLYFVCFSLLSDCLPQIAAAVSSEYNENEPRESSPLISPRQKWSNTHRKWVDNFTATVCVRACLVQNGQSLRWYVISLVHSLLHVSFNARFSHHQRTGFDQFNRTTETGRSVARGITSVREITRSKWRGLAQNITRDSN